MKQEGPQLAHLLHRLAECPAEFRNLALDDPLNDEQAALVTAIIADWMRIFEPDFMGREINDRLSYSSNAHAGLLAIVAWLLAEPWFVAQNTSTKSLLKLLCNKRFLDLSDRVPAEMFVTDSDRREELVRLCLSLLDLRPAGETLVQSKDRLNTLDTVERERILKKTAAAEKRAREIREAMEKARAMESASRYGE